ncbi:MAG TPA: MarC family protein [Acidobacteriota bacterium]|nr:MarC family protein [Acidobacteriota bacterium]
MEDVTFWFATLKTFTTLFIIVDPFLSLAVFINLVKDMSFKDKMKQASIASGVALGLLLVFLFIGDQMLQIVGVTLPSFKVAGGIVLLLLAIQTVLGIEFGNKHQKRRAAAVIIGTPLLCGPGAITTTIVFAQKYGFAPVLVAILACMILTWLILLLAGQIHKVMGNRLTEVMSRVFGIILAAMSVEMIKTGIIEIIRAFIA